MRKLGQRKTGKYVATLGTENGDFWIDVEYHGPYAGGQTVRVWLEPDPSDATAAEMRGWFRESVRGDLDVADLLAESGHDEFGNRRGRGGPARVRL